MRCVVCRFRRSAGRRGGGHGRAGVRHFELFLAFLAAHIFPDDFVRGVGDIQSDSRAGRRHGLQFRGLVVRGQGRQQRFKAPAKRRVSGARPIQEGSAFGAIFQVVGARVEARQSTIELAVHGLHHGGQEQRMRPGDAAAHHREAVHQCQGLRQHVARDHAQPAKSLARGRAAALRSAHADLEDLRRLRRVRQRDAGGFRVYAAHGANRRAFLGVHPRVEFVPQQPRFAGAGIVADSNPKTEYEETRNKALALFKAIEAAETGASL